MKQRNGVLYILACFALSLVYCLIITLVIANIAIPIICMIYFKSAWWLCLYAAEPLLIFIGVIINTIVEDM